MTFNSPKNLLGHVFWLQPVTVYPKLGSTTFDKFCYKWLYEANERQINAALIPRLDDTDIIMKEMDEFQGYCIENIFVNNSGIACTVLTLGGLKPFVKENYTPNQIAQKMIVITRKHMQMTRLIDCVPFIEWIDLNHIVLCIPVSILGLRTLENLQKEYCRQKRLQTAKKAAKERRIEHAMENLHNNR